MVRLRVYYKRHRRFHPHFRGLENWFARPEELVTDGDKGGTLWAVGNVQVLDTRNALLYDGDSIRLELPEVSDLNIQTTLSVYLFYPPTEDVTSQVAQVIEIFDPIGAVSMGGAEPREIAEPGHYIRMVSEPTAINRLGLSYTKETGNHKRCDSTSHI
jgi:hypothetical protein